MLLLLLLACGDVSDQPEGRAVQRGGVIDCTADDRVTVRRTMDEVLTVWECHPDEGCRQVPASMDNGEVWATCRAGFWLEWSAVSVH